MNNDTTITSTDRINDLLKLLIGAESLTTQQLQEYSRQFSSYMDDVRSEAAALEKRAQNITLSLNKSEAIAAALGLTVAKTKKERATEWVQSERDKEYT